MTLLEVNGLVKHFSSAGILGGGKGVVHAVNGVDLSVAKGEVVGLVGESGCGKSTLGKTVLRLYDPTAGAIRFDGTDITTLSQSALRPLRRRMQIVFQDPYASLNPRATVEAMLGEAIRFHRIVEPEGVSARIDELLGLVGLGPETRRKYPHEFSGGQRQRIGIARALSVMPEFLLLDEPVSALDVSIRAQILNLLADLKDRLGLTYLFISHDLAVVEHFCDRVMVMYLGRIVESLPAKEMRSSARHPYTEALLRRAPLEGDVPSARVLPPGCAFADRCPKAEPGCREQVPKLVSLGPDRLVACPVVAKGP